MEKMDSTIKPKNPEKTGEALYLEALQAKRDLLGSHKAMNQVRKNVDKRIEEISEDKFREDPEVQQYEILKKEYDRAKKVFDNSLKNLSEDERKKISGLTSLDKVDSAMASRINPTGASETGSVKEEGSGLTLDRIDSIIASLRAAGNFSEAVHWQVKRRKFLEGKKAETKTDAIEEGVDKDVPGESLKEKVGDFLAGRNAISGEDETVEDRMSPLGLRKEAMESVLSGKKSTESAQSQKTEKPADVLTLQEIEEKILFAKRQTLGLKGESVEYWEAKKAELIEQGIRNSVATATPLELAYWEAEREAFESYKSRIKRGSPSIVPEQGKKPESLAKAEEKIEKLPVSDQVAESKKVEKTELEESFIEPPKPVEPIKESELRLKLETEFEPEFAPIPESKPEHVVSVLQKEEVDTFIDKGGGSPEVILNMADTGPVEGAVVEKIIDEAFTDAEVMREIEKVPQGPTFLKKIRDRIKNKTIIYVGVGLMTLMALKEGVRGNLPGVPTSVVKVFDKVPDMGVVADFPKMVLDEAARYKVAPYLVAKFIGSNDYFGLEAVKATNAVGLESAATSMYDKSLDSYIENFSETRKSNRFTTIDKHTVRSYIDTFTQLYTGQEQADSGVETYKKLQGFLETNFGAAKAYELALKVSSEKKLSPELLAAAKADARKQGAVIAKALGKSQIYFNQEDGVFNVVHDGKLIDTYASRAGFMNVPKGTGIQAMGYERTPDGKFTISSVERGYSTLRWRDSFLPYGAEIRASKTGEIEYQYRGKWYFATGPEATYFDQGNMIQPNKSESGRKYLSDRSKGESPLTKSDFYSVSGLMTHWDKNPFGPISYRLAGRGELIHSNPTDSDNILHPSHGCIRLDKEDIKTLEHYVGAGVSKIQISSESGKTWSSKS